MSTDTPPKSTAIAFTDPAARAEQEMFILAQKRAQVYAASDLVPTQYRNNIPNVMIASNMAKRMGADVLQVMQNLYIVHGNPGWSAQFLIATFNMNGRFSSIRYRFTGEKGTDSWGCIAYCREIESGDELSGTEVTIKMAKDEGWYGKNGSKWKTMPEQMLRYRAAAYLIRTVAPEIGMGLRTEDELRDMNVESGKFRPRGNLQSSELIIDPPVNGNGHAQHEDDAPSGDLDPTDPALEFSPAYEKFTDRMARTTKTDSLVTLASEVDNSDDLWDGERESLLEDLNDRIRASKEG